MQAASLKNMASNQICVGEEPNKFSTDTPHSVET